MSIAVAIGIGQYSLFYVYMQRSFVKRFKAFKDAFYGWMETEAKKFIESLTSMVKEKTEPKKLSDFVTEWGTKTANLLSILETYKSLNTYVKWILLLLAGSVVTSALYIQNPNAINQSAEQPIYWINIAVVLLFAAILAIFWYIYSFHKISSKITQFELGESMETILSTSQKD
jgi:hypothetical protein